MMSLEYIRQMADDAAAKAFEEKQEPVVLGAGQFTPPFPIPFIGSLVETHDLPFEEVGTFFVDSSGWGVPGEAALTVDQFARKAIDLIATAGQPIFWGITEAGQFQVYVAAYKRRDDA